MHRNIGLLLASMILIIVFSGITGFEVGKLTPVLRLMGATHATLGDLLHIHGQNFLVGEKVIFTRDSSSTLDITPRPMLQTIPPERGERTVSDRAAGPVSGNTLVVGKGGMFDATISVEKNWGIGRHTIQASEQFGLLHAEISFNVLRPAVNSQFGYTL